MVLLIQSTADPPQYLLLVGDGSGWAQPWGGVATRDGSQLKGRWGLEALLGSKKRCLYIMHGEVLVAQHGHGGRFPEQEWPGIFCPDQDLWCTLRSELTGECRHGFGEPERLVCVFSQSCQSTWISLISYGASISSGSESSLALPITSLFCFH